MTQTTTEGTEQAVVAADVLSTDHTQAVADGAHRHGGSSGVSDTSYADRFASADPAAFEIPTGREEEWRFTPLRRLRGLLEGAPLTGDGFTVDVQTPDGVTAGLVPVEQSRRGASGYVPIDRVSARVWDATREVFTIDIPAEAEVDEPVVVTVAGPEQGDAIPAHLLVTVGAHAKATVVSFFEGSATFAENVRGRGRRRREA